VKTILVRGPNEEDLPKREIRRFEIDEEAVGSYDYLRGKIVALYPDLTNESVFRLMWTDEDGDNVCFSSDEELSQAMRFAASTEQKVLKLLVKMPFPAGNVENTQKGGCAGGNARGFENWCKKLEKNKAKAARHGQKYADHMQFIQNLQNQAGHFASQMANNLSEGLHHGEKVMKDMSSHMENHMANHMKNKAKGECSGGNGESTSTKVTKTVVHDNGDVDMHIDIPIKHMNSSSTSPDKIYPEINKQNDEWNTVDEEEVKLAKAVKAMEELGFSGKWVEELLKHVNCNIEAAVDALNSKQ